MRNSNGYFGVWCAIWLYLSAGAAYGQYSVMPGDANRNGRVDHYDVLHVGYAYGSVGPSRLSPNGSPTSQAIPQLWPLSFPDGINYAYADCNGNGVIDWQDFLNIYQNYHFEQDSVVELSFPQPIPGLDPQLSFTQNTITTFPGDVLEIPIHLAYPPGQETDFQGIAFTMEYQTDHINGIFTNFQSSYPADDEQAFYFQNISISSLGVLETALTRFGQNPIGGEGEIATAVIIIEDDLIGLLLTPQDSIETTIRIKDVLFKDGDFFSVPVFTDSIRVVIRHPDAVSSHEIRLPEKDMQVFPNPSSGALWVNTPFPVSTLSVWDVAGRCVHQETVAPGTRHLLELGHLPAGVFTLKGHSAVGHIQKRILIVH